MGERQRLRVTSETPKLGAVAMSSKRPLPTPPPDPPRRSPFEALRSLVPPGSEAAPSPTPVPTPPPPSKSSTKPRGRVTVRRERSGRGGKTVTIAEGPGLAGEDLAQLARDAAAGLGLGARVEDGAVVLQGDQRDRLAAWLRSRGFEQVALGN